MLRAKEPEAVVKRLKLFMFGPAGSGKTTAAIQFPNSYIIDGERGSENYPELIKASGSAVFQSGDMNEVIAEVKALLTDRHGYKTLVIDPITTIYNDLLEKCELKVGSDFGRHFGEANKTMKRLANLIMALDMNVIVTAHAKTEYGANLSKLGYTFDGWKSLDYWFDLVVELGKKGNKRMAKVVKTRVASFPDGDVFEWSYAQIEKRYGAEILGKTAAPVELATSEQIAEVVALLQRVRLPDGTVDKWFAKSGVDTWDDMPAARVTGAIDYLKARLPQPPVSDTPGEAERIGILFEEWLAELGFDAEGIHNVKIAAARSRKVTSVVLFTADDWDRLRAAVKDGKFDKFKNAPVGAGK